MSQSILNQIQQTGIIPVLVFDSHELAVPTARGTPAWRTAYCGGHLAHSGGCKID